MSSRGVIGPALPPRKTRDEDSESDDDDCKSFLTMDQLSRNTMSSPNPNPKDGVECGYYI